MAVLASLPPGFLCSPFLQLHPQKEDISVCKSPCQLIISSNTLFLYFLLQDGARSTSKKTTWSKYILLFIYFFIYFFKTVVLQSHFAKISSKEKCKVKDEAGWECWARDPKAHLENIWKRILIASFLFCFFPPKWDLFLSPTNFQWGGHPFFPKSWNFRLATLQREIRGTRASINHEPELPTRIFIFHHSRLCLRSCSEIFCLF